MKIKTSTLKAWFLFLIVGMMFFSQVNLMYAQTTAADYLDSGAEKSIKDYLCTPKDSNGEGQTLFECIDRIYKFTIAFASAVGVLFITVAGWVYMSAEGNQESVDKAKNILTTTIISLIILLGGYVLLKGINPDLVQLRQIQPLDAGPEAAAPASAVVTLGAQGIDPETIPPVAANTDGTCPEPDKNYRLADSSMNAATCYTSTCDNYSAAIQSAANKINISGVDEVALIKAIMINESACAVNAQSNSTIPSCGLMQLQPDTASRFKSVCGVPDSTNITCSWLKNSTNAAASICMGAKYLEELSTSRYCGTAIVDIAAGYNGGTKACNASKDCPGKKAWECLYDNTDHTQCNTGYKQTRNYSPKVAGCYNYYN